MPDNADWFFERLHDEMLRKLPTLTTSHVHNAKRKLLLTAFHFAVFGRYPQQLIQLTLNDRQVYLISLSIFLKRPRKLFGSTTLDPLSALVIIMSIFGIILRYIILFLLL